MPCKPLYLRQTGCLHYLPSTVLALYLASPKTAAFFSRILRDMRRKQNTAFSTVCLHSGKNRNKISQTATSICILLGAACRGHHPHPPRTPPEACQRPLERP